MPYVECQSHYKDVLSAVIGQTRPGLFGSHTNCKTAYLLAVWGGGEEGDIRMSVRHKQAETALTYKCDAKCLLHIAKSNGREPEAAVPKWKPIFLKDVGLG